MHSPLLHFRQTEKLCGLSPLQDTNVKEDVLKDQIHLLKLLS